ncbi:MULTISPECIES: hypothetical protein [Enterobacter]|jgi:hypothetical protein|uniref:hypothetical protein n=1 Tax=Enterobacter TaxID=547 RepID=UPI0013E2B8CE|nr:MULTISPECIES: hypothetical protein [Enterobacter]MCK7012245.1 hypothetical protein [Enterobacter roggenkampii]MCK7026177.1 hypothetical protein [Enterobacter roggenkampii]
MSDHVSGTNVIAGGHLIASSVHKKSAENDINLLRIKNASATRLYFLYPFEDKFLT